MSNQQQAYKQLCEQSKQAAMVDSILQLLEWDERTKMPSAGGAYRADQAAYLAGLTHQKQTDPKIGSWLEELADSALAADSYSETGAIIRLLRRDYEKKVRLPQALVEELTRTAVQGQQAWAEARQANDFAKFQPLLEKTVGLKRQEAAALGYEATPYDALLDQYEPGETAENVGRILSGLRDALVPLVQAIANSKTKPDVAVLAREFPIATQEQLGKQAAAEIGFDFEAGRLDVTDHPFCVTLGPRDIRLTTRYHLNSFNDGFFSILHEAGHGIYEQGLPDKQFGTPLGEYTSMAIHESQSRMWENQVGLSRAFWQYFYPQAQQSFPAALNDVELDAFHAAINRVQPSLIRVEADEVTYNLHILIRFELEKALIEDDLQVADLPAAWNEKYQHYLGITPPNDAEGALQDVHWSAGLFGYFPTYALGNLYAAQFFVQANKDLGDLDAAFAKGQFRPLREWLRENIHQHGRCYTPAELAKRITGAPLSHQPLMEHLTRKYGKLYGL